MATATKGTIMDVMLDLETLSTRPDATILTFGACKFSPYKKHDIVDGIYFRVSVDEQITLGRHVDDNTVAWWAQQAEGSVLRRRECVPIRYAYADRLKES